MDQSFRRIQIANVGSGWQMKGRGVPVSIAGPIPCVGPTKLPKSTVWKPHFIRALMYRCFWPVGDPRPGVGIFEGGILNGGGANLIEWGHSFIQEVRLPCGLRGGGLVTGDNVDQISI